VVQGSWFFLPRRVLAGSTTLTHIDVLEAFFHVFLFIVVGHAGPSMASSRIQNWGDLAGYGAPLAIALPLKNFLIESEKFKYTVQTKYFKEPTAQLAADLHSFFHTRWRNQRDAALAGTVLSRPDSLEDYLEFTAHINNAITNLSIICVDVLGLDAPSLPSMSDGSSDLPTARIEEIVPTRTPEIRKRKLSVALGEKRQNAWRKCKRLRVSYFE
jgi:hypothetical protein